MRSAKIIGFRHGRSRRHTLGALGGEVGVAAHQAAQAALQGRAQAPDALLEALRLVHLQASTHWARRHRAHSAAASFTQA